MDLWYHFSLKTAGSEASEVRFYSWYVAYLQFIVQHFYFDVDWVYLLNHIVCSQNLVWYAVLVHVCGVSYRSKPPMTHTETTSNNLTHYEVTKIKVKSTKNYFFTMFRLTSLAARLPLRTLWQPLLSYFKGLLTLGCAQKHRKQPTSTDNICVV